MENLRQEILNKSLDIIQQLASLTAYFEDAVLMNIYLQTQLIHKLFEENEELEVTKLDLFHVQYTTTLIALLTAIEQKNQRAVSMYNHEIDLNNEMIQKIQEAIAKDGGFDSEKLKQTKRMSKSLRDLYSAIYYKSSDYPFKLDISTFGINFYKDHFFETEQDVFDKITNYDKSNTYRNTYYCIDKQLLLALGKANFTISFVAGVKMHPMLVEIYKIPSEDVYFLFMPAKNLFLICDINLFPIVKWEQEMSKKSRVIKNLMKNNLKAEANIRNTHKYISHEVSELLGETHKTITDLDFLASLEDINTQANILKSMLDTKMI